MRLRGCKISIISPASFYAYLDVVKASYAKQQTEELTNYETHQTEVLVKLLMADLFGDTPTITKDATRYQIIALLQQLYPNVFEIFLKMYITLNEKAIKIDDSKNLNPAQPTTSSARQQTNLKSTPTTGLKK